VPYRLFFAAGTGVASAVLGAESLLTRGDQSKAPEGGEAPFYDMVVSASRDIFELPEEADTGPVDLDEVDYLGPLDRDGRTHNLAQWCADSLTEMTQNRSENSSIEPSASFHLTRADVGETHNFNGFEVQNTRANVKQNIEQRLARIPSGSALDVYACGAPFVAKSVQEAVKEIHKEGNFKDKTIHVHAESAGS